MIKGGSGAIIRDFGENKLIKLQKFNSLEDFTESQLYNQYIWLTSIHNASRNIVPKMYEVVKHGDYYGYIIRKIPIKNQIVNNSLIQNLVNISNGLIHMKNPFPDDIPRFNTYAARVHDHLTLFYQDDFMIRIKQIVVNGYHFPSITFKNSILDIYNELMEYESFFSAHRSFCHGDFTLENLIISDDEDNIIRMIDPNYIPNVWNSWLLDISKLYQSLHYGYETIFSEKSMSLKFKIENDVLMVNTGCKFSQHLSNMTNNKLFNFLKGMNDSIYPMFLLLEFTHYVRMLKYKRAISIEDYLKAYIIMNLVWQDYKGVMN